MPIRIDRNVANQMLDDALDLAASSSPLPVEWTSHARAIFELEEKTWTPAFATLLLAKAVDETVDALSLKSNATPPNPFAYSARTLCHGVVVPAAVRHGFSIRNTGREPLNNSPFVSAARIEEIEKRALNTGNFRHFLGVATRANELTSDEAFEALAAFLREAKAVAVATKSVTVRAVGLTSGGLGVAVRDFLRPDAPDRPKRLQAFAAACLDQLFEDVRSRRLNDPSRDIPGDVHVLGNERTSLAMEVRGKVVTPADLTTFAYACDAASIDRAVVFVDAPKQIELQPHVIVCNEALARTEVAAFTSASELLASAMLWSESSVSDSVESLSQCFLIRLREIEVKPTTLQEWSRALALVGGRWPSVE